MKALWKILPDSILHPPDHRKIPAHGRQAVPHLYIPARHALIRLLHPHPDGECLCRLYIYAAGFWTDRKSYFHHIAAGLCADFHCVNVFHGGKDIPAGAVIEKKTKNEGRLFHKP